jgi:putative acyl-CoA dehydrogenase
VAAAGMMRAGVVQAVHHAGHRTAFQKRLIDQPLMRNVLADLVVEWAAATMLAARVARSYDDEAAAPLARITVGLAKYWLNKRLPAHVCEALECHGGAGYVEESPMPRLYRQAPVNGIWEGSGNVICLDILRSLEKEPACADMLMVELAAARGGNRRLDAAVDRLKDDLRDLGDQQSRARRLAGAMAVALQASLLVRYGSTAVADAFCATRLEHDWGGTYGTLPGGIAFDDIIRLGMVGG